MSLRPADARSDDRIITIIRRRTTEDKDIRGINSSAEIFISDHGDIRRHEYNCLGFAVDRLHKFMPEGPFCKDVPALLAGLQCEQLQRNLSSTEEGFALWYSPETWWEWHAAKHLRGDWYESKDFDRLRFVHQLKDITYKGVPTYWIMHESESAKTARNKFVQDVFKKSFDCFPKIGDSMPKLEAEGGPAGSYSSEDERILVRLRELAARYSIDPV